MTDQNNNSPPNSYPTGRRRSSFAGQTFADLFSSGRTRPSETNNSPPTNQFNGPITSAAQEASRRRLSLSTVGLSASPNQTSPFSARNRGSSVSSSNAPSVDESAIDEDPSSAAAGQPNTPFAHRVSFGARALRDMNKSGNAGGGGTGSNGRASISTSTIPEDVAAESGGKKTSPDTVTPPTTVKGRADSRFNWADNMRTRAERTSSISGGGGFNTSPGGHHRAKSVAVMEQPVKTAPRPVNVPDHFQERILKGDFYMD